MAAWMVSPVYDFSDLTIIIPTLNEGENMQKLVRSITKKYRGASIIVADDGSTDNTKVIVEAFSRRHRGNVMFLDRKRSKVHGLTASVLDGALAAHTKKIVVMDGDMQHPFEKVGDLARVLDDYDMAIGVRSTVKDWGVFRKIISKCMALFVHSVFRLRRLNTCNDMMSGFFGIRTKLFKSLINENKKSFVPEGYKVMLDILRTADRTVRVKEVRYSTFHLRRHGKSKLGIGQAVNTLKSTFR